MKIVEMAQLDYAKMYVVIMIIVNTGIYSPVN